MSVYRPKDRDGRPRSPFYLYDFQCGGRRFHGSTGTTTRREAERAEELKREQAKADVAAARDRDYTRIDAAFGRFWLEKGQHDADPDTTFARQERLQDVLGMILKERRRAPVLSSIDEDVLAAYVARVRAMPVLRKRRKGPPSSRPRSASDVNRDVQLLRRIMRRARLAWKLAIEMPDWKQVLSPEPEERVVDVPAALEEKIREAMREDFRPALEWLILSGLRTGNALPLHPSQVDFVNDVVTVKLKSRRPGGRTFILPLSRRMKLLLANAIGQHPEAVFTYVSRAARDGRARGGRYPLTAATFYDEFKRAAAAAGAPELRPHDLRHAAGTRILRATGNLRAAQKQLAHTRISTTTKYAHFLVDELRAAMEATHSVTPNPEETPEQEAAANANIVENNADSG